MLITIVAWIVLANAAGVIASNQGRSGRSWFFVSVIISPIIAVILLMILPVRSEEAEKRRTNAGIINMAIILGMTIVIVEVLHIAENQSVSDTISSILEKRFNKHGIEISGVSYPFYYSLPYISYLDLLPISADGSFQLSRPKGTDSCKFEIYKFNFSLNGPDYIISIPGSEVYRITECV